MYNQDKICQRFVVVWTLVLPTLVEKLVEFIPSLKLEHSFKLQLDNLEVFGNNVGLRRSTEFVYTFCGFPGSNESKLVSYWSMQQQTRLTLCSVLSSARARVV
jgi:hypothetical protein